MDSKRSGSFDRYAEGGSEVAAAPTPTFTRDCATKDCIDLGRRRLRSGWSPLRARTSEGKFTVFEF